SNRYAGTGSNLSTVPLGVGLGVNQTVFDGFRTQNSVRQAEWQSREADAGTRNIEQNTLLAAVTAYMDVAADTAILDRVHRTIATLSEQLRHTRERHGLGEVTKTDVAQVESRLASARAQGNIAEANLRTSVANYQQVTGAPPSQLSPARAVEDLI